VFGSQGAEVERADALPLPARLGRYIDLRRGDAGSGAPNNRILVEELYTA
jgi:hypothetical protein